VLGSSGLLQVVEGEVQVEDVDAGFAEYAELARGDLCGDDALESGTD
jgi:hypothetical protein